MDAPATTFQAGAGRGGSRLFGPLGFLAIALGVYQAARLAWTSDDAYISFRYAHHLVDGLGLVYNAGERVEGYTNFLWTLWSALGLKLGVPVETWANASGIACFAATIALLVLLSWRRARGVALAVPIPLAALWFALQPDACTFATGGLETGLFTLLAVAGYLTLVGLGGRGDIRRAALAAALLGLGCLTRPDGVLFAALGGGYVFLAARPRMRAAFAYAGTLAAIGVPFALWKLAYYGDLMPNTYYAKSAMIPWWSQGWAYVWLYFSKYPPLVVGPVLVLLLAIFGRRIPRPLSRSDALDRPAETNVTPTLAPGLLAVAFALTYTLYVMRVGGDFMFARLLIPATPFYAIAAETGLAVFAGRAAPSRGAAAAAFAIPALLGLATIALARDPFSGVGWVKGIVDERAYYETRDREGAARHAKELADLTRGLPVRAAIVCEQAISGYYSQVPQVIEACAGLTDPAVAHQKIRKRGRVGHEKKATLEYLVDDRRAHLVVGHNPKLDDALRALIPVIDLRYGTTKATLLTWDPDVMRAFRKRGARFEDFPATLDRFIAKMPEYSDSAVADMYMRAKRFYFAEVDDPRREAPFLRRLGRIGRPLVRDAGRRGSPSAVPLAREPHRLTGTSAGTGAES